MAQSQIYIIYKTNKIVQSHIFDDFIEISETLCSGPDGIPSNQYNLQRNNSPQTNQNTPSIQAKKIMVRVQS